MPPTVTIESLHRELVQIKKMLTEQKEKGTWVKVSFIMDITGWNAEQMRRARQQGLIKYRKDPEKGFIYELESLPTMFIKAKSI